jgi:hypothetical protein
MLEDLKGTPCPPPSLNHSEVFVPDGACIHIGGVGPSTLFGQDAAGFLVHVSGAKSGASDELTCPDCAGRLMAKKGSVRVHHFAHASGTDCSGAGETALHRLAKDLLRQNPEIALPALKVMGRLCEPARSVRLERVELETWEGSFRPDLKAEVQDEEGLDGYRILYIEIRVTNAVDEIKLDRMQVQGRSAIEIDLSRVDRAIDRDELALLVRTLAPRAWLFHHRGAEHSAKIAAEQKAQDAMRGAILNSSERLTNSIDNLGAEGQRGYSSPHARTFTAGDIKAMLEKLNRMGPWSNKLGRPDLETVLGDAEITDVAQALSRILRLVDGLEPQRLASWLRNGLVRRLIKFTALPVAKAKLIELASDPDEFRRQVQRLAEVENDGSSFIWGTGSEDFAIRALSSETPDGGSILGFWLAGYIEQCRKYTNMIVTPRQKPKWIRESLPGDMPAHEKDKLPYPFASEDDWL